MALLEVSNVTKTYTTRLGNMKVPALRGITLKAEDGEFIAIMGESGSGKTTLLNLLAALDRPTSGQILLDGKEFSSIPEKQRAAFRRDHLGFVFQEFNLLDTFSVRDNILLPLVLQSCPVGDMESRLRPLLEQLGLTGLEDKFPWELSGGQKQRTAIARAMITHPRLLLADEPTGALDSRSASLLMALLQQLHHGGQTILMVTHSVQAASYASRVLFIRDGEVYNEIYRGNETQECFYQQIIATLTVLSGGGEDA